jgi:hypothetical protein
MAEWRTIPTFPNYEVSDDGQVRRGSPGHRTKIGFVLKQKPNREGYPALRLRRKGSRQAHNVTVHSLMLLVFEGPALGRVARHLDGDPCGNRLSNLKYGTQVENAEDRERHGRGTKGERNGFATLSDAQALEIIASGAPTKVLAARYGVNRRTVWQVRKGVRWGHLRALEAQHGEG